MGGLEDSSIKQVARGGFVIFLGIALSFIAFIFYKVLAARYLGPADYGMLTLGITILNAASILGLAGVHQSIGKLVSHYLARNRHEKAKSIVISSLIITLSSGILIMALLYMSSSFIGKRIFGIEGLDSIIKIFSIGVPFSVTAQLLKYHFFAFRKPEYAIVSESISEKAVNLLLLVIIVSVSASLSAISWAYVAALAVSSVVAFFILSSKTKHILKKELKPRLEFKSILSFSLPLMFAGMLGVAFAWTDTIFIGIFRSDAEVGIYNAAYIIASALMIFWLSFGNIFYPVISELYSRNAKAPIRKAFESASRWIFLLILPISIIIFAMPARILSLVFGQSYANASLPLAILTIGYFFTTYFGLAENGLIAFKKIRFLAIATAFALMLNIALNAALIPIYGMTGAAIATTVSLLIINSTKFFAFKNMLKFSFNKMFYLKTIVSGIISFAAVFYTLGFLGLSSKYFFILGVIIYSVLYFALLVLFKSFSEEDIIVMEAVERKTGISLSFVKGILNR